MYEECRPYDISFEHLLLSLDSLTATYICSNRRLSLICFSSASIRARDFSKMIEGHTSPFYRHLASESASS